MPGLPRALTLVHSAPPPPATEFTSRDLIALARWVKQDNSHGYRRILVEGGQRDAGPEDGGYVLIYAAGSDWADWGVARTEAGITVWHCGTGHDVGRYATMGDALDGIPPARRTLHQPSRQRVGAATGQPRLSLVPRTSPEPVFGE